MSEPGRLGVVPELWSFAFRKTEENIMKKPICQILVTFGIGLGSNAHADISFTISPGPAGTANVTINASGTTVATDDLFLIVGSPEIDSFLPDGAPQRGGFPGGGPIPDPPISLGGLLAGNYFYRDDDSSFNYNGVDSLLGFYFGFGGSLQGTLDLSELTGSYNLPLSQFSDFVLGSFEGLTPGTRANTLQDLGYISVTVIPEPSGILLLGVASLSLLLKRRRAGPTKST